MKKRFLIVWLTFVIGSFSVFASEFLTPTVLDVRAAGMGGSYLCDFKQPFVLLNNPCGMSFSGKQVFLPSLAFDLGGPPAAASKLFDLVKSSDGGSMTDMLVDMLKESNGIFIDLDMMLPLTFSRVANNWGIGFYNNIFVRGDLPSISSVTAIAGGDLMLAGGFSVPILNNDFHRLSLGISTKLVGRFNIIYTGSVTGLTSMEFDSLPADMTLAAGFDVGATYILWDILSLSAVWKDLYLGMSHGLGTITSMSFSNEEEWRKFMQNGDLSLGVGVQVPTGILKKVLTSFSVYVDYDSFTSIFNKEKAVFLPHPLLNLSAGLEAVLFKTIALRFGMRGPYLAAGAGIDLGPFHLSMAIYGKEKGIDPGASSQVHGAFSLSFYY